MEVPCPECGQLLRVPEGLRVALVRCRVCEHVFTTSTSGDGNYPPANSAGESLAPATAYAASPRVEVATDKVDDRSVEDYDAEPMADESATAPNTQKEASSKRWMSRFGIAFVICSFLLKSPRLWKMFWPDRKPQAAAQQPVKPGRRPPRPLGEDLRPPAQPILEKFRQNRQPNRGEEAAPQ